MIDHLNEIFEYEYDHLNYTEFTEFLILMRDSNEDEKIDIYQNYFWKYYNIKGQLIEFEILTDIIEKK